MDPRRFDSLARSLAASKTRRGLLGSVTALASGALGLRGVGAQVSQRQCGNVVCGNNPAGCAPGCVCCVYANGNSRCRPPGQCGSGQAACPADRPLVDPVRGCVQCLGASHCPEPAGECTTTACVNGVCMSTVSEDGAECAGGVCVGGVCCNIGPGLPGGEICDALNNENGECCTGGTTCCGGEGCCTDCFTENDGGDPLCCLETDLCPPRSLTNPEPPHCCAAGDSCLADNSPAGASCYIAQRDCNGQYCGGDCCGDANCCLNDTYCSGGTCVDIPEIECVEDSGCPDGFACVEVVRALIEPSGPTIEIIPGFCCPGNRVCDSQLGPEDYNEPNAFCCSAGQFCNGPRTCCALEGCSPRGGRTRI